ncbi:MAG: bacteriohemerythrin [Magnetococcales bacterium]|nr:bacteriohemerythrin [Magnetococcales bacterium]
MLKLFHTKYWVLSLWLLVTFSFSSTLHATPTTAPLSVVFCQDCTPFQYQNEKGKPEGLIIDHWRLWEEKTAQKVRYIPAPWHQTLSMVREGKADAHAGLHVSQEREQYLDFGIDLHQSDSLFFYHKDLPKPSSQIDFKAYRIGVITGGFLEGYLKQQQPTAAIISYPSFQQLMEALKQKDLLVFASDAHSALYHMKKSGLDSHFVADKGHPIKSNRWHVATQKGNQPLLEQINRGMAQLSEQEKKQINKRWETYQKQRIIPLTLEEDRWVREHVIRIGVEEWTPYIFSDKPGHASGVGGDFLNKVLEKTGLKGEIVSDAWSTLLNGLKQKSIDLLPLTYYTEERATYGLYSKPFFYGREFLYVKEENRSLHSLEDLAQGRIAVVKGYGTIPKLKKRYPKATIIETPSLIDSINAVLNGEADALMEAQMAAEKVILDNAIIGLRGISQTVFKASPMHFFSRIDEPILASILQKGLDAITDDERNEIFQKWFTLSTTDKNRVRLTPNERLWIATHPELRMGVDRAWPPFEFLEEGLHKGISSGYTDWISSQLGIRLEPATQLSWQEVIQQVKEGGLDILPAVMHSPDREKFLNFTKPYIRFPMVVAAHKQGNHGSTLNALKKKRVGVVAGYVTEEILRRDHPHIIRVPYPTLQEALQALSDAQIHAVFDNLGAITYQMDQLKTDTIKIADATNYNFELAIGVRKDWPELVAILDKTLAFMTKEQHAAIRNSWLAVEVNFGTNLSTILYWAIPLVLLTAIILFFILSWNRRLGQEVHERRRAELELAQKSNLLEAILANLQQGLIAYDQDFRLIVCNDQMRAIRKMPEALSKPGSTFEAWVRHDAQMGEFGPGDVEEIVQNLLKKAMNEASHHLERSRPDGSIIEIQGGALPGGGFVSTFTDITQRKESEANLKKLSIAVEESPVSVIITDQNGVIEYVNKKFSQTTGYSPLEALGKKTSLLSSGKTDPTIYQQMWSTLSTGKLWRGVLLNQRKNGALYWKQISIAPIRDEAGKITHFVSVGEDITKQKKMAEERDQAMNLIASSIQYASRIQRSILPTETVLQESFADYFVLWKPRDTVGGDIYWHRSWGNGSLIMLGDCTGHGVPGAFITLIANGALDEAYLETPPGDPAALLQRMHQLIQSSLGQGENGSGTSDDGIEIGACFLSDTQGCLIFAGARFDLFILQDNQVEIIKGTKSGLGYRGIATDIQFTNHAIDTIPQQTFYMTSDGLIDQIGGEKRRSFGKKRFMSLIATHGDKPLSKQKELFLQALEQFQGKQKRRDDLSVIGFKCLPPTGLITNANLIEMDHSLLVGFKPIDDDHQRLFSMINKLNNAIIQGHDREAILAILSELIDYTAWHFRHEDRLMQVNDYPEQEKHRDNHKMLVDEVLKIEQDIRENNRDVSTDLMLFLLEWLNGHIHQVDKKLADFLNTLDTVQVADKGEQGEQEPFFVLDASLMVGFAAIDDDHQKLVDLINQLHFALDKNLGYGEIFDSLNQLVDYTSWHFRHEERLMQSNDYPNMIDHKTEHEALISKVNQIRNQFMADDKAAPNELNFLIKNWLINHIHEVDHKLATFLSRRKRVLL